MKITPTSKNGGALVELNPGESQIPAQSVATAPVFTLKTILVPMDFSDSSRKALDYAVAFAKRFGAELLLLHVVEPYPVLPDMPPCNFETPQDGSRELESLQKVIDKTVSSHGVLRNGIPHLEITTAARELAADLLIISTHGRKGLSRRIFGSTTEKVVRYAPCPVLIVRQSEHEFIPDIHGNAQNSDAHPCRHFIRY